jgi:hypothetical protein
MARKGLLQEQMKNSTVIVSTDELMKVELIGSSVNTLLHDAVGAYTRISIC